MDGRHMQEVLIWEHQGRQRASTPMMQSHAADPNGTTT